MVHTPILLMTFAVLGDGPAAVADVQKVATAASIDWTRTGIAVHGYAGPAQTRASIQYIVNAGYPCFMTEFYSVPWGTGVHTVHADPEMTADMERLKISWLSFHHTPNEVFTPWRYTDVIERAERLAGLRGHGVDERIVLLPAVAVSRRRRRIACREWPSPVQ